MPRKDAETDSEYPTEAQLASFESLKKKLVTPPILALAKLGNPYRLETDASAYQVGFWLRKLQDDDIWHPIGYRSKSLTPAVRNYCATDRECYPIVWGMQQLRPYLEGVRVTGRTDYGSLRWILNHINFFGCRARWRMLLSEFDYEIEYIPGQVNSVSDAMSRILIPVEDKTHSTRTFPYSTWISRARARTHAHGSWSQLRPVPGRANKTTHHHLARKKG